MRRLKLMAAMALAPLAAGCLGTPRDVEPYTLTDADRALVERDVKSRLKDPFSAVFGGSLAARDPKTGQIHVCGQVNARNSFGGYTGDTPFYGTLPPDRSFAPTFSVESFGGSDFENNYTIVMCRNNGV